MAKAEAVPEKPKALMLPSAAGGVRDISAFESPLVLNRLRSLLPPRSSDPTRFVRVAMLSVVKSKALRQCTFESLQECLLMAAEAGLEVGTPMQHAWFVPYKSEAKLIIGYQGYLHLCYQTPRVVDVSAECVYEAELSNFVFMREPEPVFRHVPYMGPDKPGPFVAAYAVATLKPGGGGKESLVHKLVLMRRFEIDRISKGKEKGKPGDSPWVDHYDEMAKKTVIRRMVKTLAKTTRLGRALAADFDYEGIEEAKGQELVFSGQKGIAGVKARLNPRTVDSTARGLDEPPEGQAVGDVGYEPGAAG